MFISNSLQYLNNLNQQQNESQFINNNQNINIQQGFVSHIIYYLFKILEFNK